ncbi:hypothetical protein Lalb_Chr12g0204141 [Lupinus albus]|uniref:Uncharacterized protein n=1 Tax=Lupinus albus TaxID=3870 RepID=A0A6A4PMY7_LUPAL|nr:hypothetical protein Lalb_Chr12g0204141 [Lupinus albus]
MVGALDWCFICFDILPSYHTYLLQVVSKNEEEEFNTGPLFVLMMSVKNNTQAMAPEFKHYQ